MDKHVIDSGAIRGFVLKTIVRLIIMTVIVAVVFMVTQTPVITNNIAMGQMENSNDWFVAMTVYQRFANAADIFSIVSVVVTLGFIGWDGYKLARTLKSEPTTDTKNEKEN